jgi:glycosyltransferase involved in cell wall biosynthesis
MGWYLKSYWQAVRACRRLGVPILVRGDSQLQKGRSWIKRLVKEVAYPVLLRRFDGFLIVGQRAKEYLLHYGVPEKRMFFSPHCVDNAWFRGMADRAVTEAQKLRNEMACERDAVRLLFVGKLTVGKRPLDVIDAAHRLGARAIPAACGFVGDGELATSVEHKAKMMGVRATMFGFRNQSEMPAIYRASDILVLPSESESWGLVVNEAMACGVPVVVSDGVGCGPDLAIPGETGEVYSVGDVVELSDSIERLKCRLGSIELSESLAAKMAVYSVERAADGVVAAARAAGA